MRLLPHWCWVRKSFFSAAKSWRCSRLNLFPPKTAPAPGPVRCAIMPGHLPYREVSPLLPMMVLSGGLFAAGQIAVLSLLSGANSQRLITPKIGTALLGVLLNFGGAFWLGLSGVVYAGVAVSSIYLVWIVMLVKREKIGGTNPGAGPVST